MIQDMINELTEALSDAEKHDSGNNAAGTRVRKVMQSCKNLAQDVRIRVQGDKNSR
ncbi:MAG: histone H1 [Methanobacteriota archaeon]|nr:MAG: histone H1 [Euryarchaeota archaeon]